MEGTPVNEAKTNEAQGFEQATEETELPQGFEEVSATDPKSEKTASATLDFGKDAADAIERFGNQVVYDSYVAHQRVKAQNIIRPMIKAGKDPDEIREYMENNWYPGAQVRDSESAAIARFDEMSPEEQAAYIQKLQERAAAGK